MPIVDYLDIQLDSSAYNFLKDVGVREIPDLELLIDRIVEEHREKTSEERNEDKYQVPKAFCFLIKHFVQHYRNSWNEKFKHAPIIPSCYPTKLVNDQSRTDKTNNVILSQTNEVFLGLF